MNRIPDGTSSTFLITENIQATAWATPNIDSMSFVIPFEDTGATPYEIDSNTNAINGLADRAARARRSATTAVESTSPAMPNFPWRESTTASVRPARENARARVHSTLASSTPSSRTATAKQFLSQSPMKCGRCWSARPETDSDRTSSIPQAISKSSAGIAVVLF